MQKVPFWTFSDPTTPGFSEWWKMLVLMAAGRGQLPDGCGSMLTASTTSSTRQHTQTTTGYTNNTMFSQTSPFRQCIHRKAQIANVQLFTGHWWTCSRLFAFRDCSGHKRETLLDIAAPTKLVRPVLNNLSSFLNRQKKLSKA